MYTAEIKTVGESMARSTTDVRSFKIFAVCRTMQALTEEPAEPAWRAAQVSTIALASTNTSAAETASASPLS